MKKEHLKNTLFHQLPRDIQSKPNALISGHFFQEHMIPTILITRKLFPDLMNQIEKDYKVILWEQDVPPDKQWILDHLASADGIITMLTDKIDDQVISNGAGQQLKVISQMAVGFDNIDIQSATRHQIAVGNTPGVLTETTADFTWALMMALARQVVTSNNEVHHGIWRPWGPEVFAGADVFGKTLGIIGYGRIGQAVARRAAGFGMRVLVSGHNTPDQGTLANWEFCDFDNLLQQSDFVSLHANLNSSTRGLLGKKQLELMKPTAFLINTARGAMIDHNALYDSLIKHKLAGAALDVFDPEPIPLDHPLLKLPNVIITPHIASASLATRHRMAEMTIENVIAGIEGKPLPYCVNPEIYKS